MSTSIACSSSWGSDIGGLILPSSGQKLMLLTGGRSFLEELVLLTVGRSTWEELVLLTGGRSTWKELVLLTGGRSA